jgi:hypothetical protein
LVTNVAGGGGGPLQGPQERPKLNTIANGVLNPGDAFIYRGNYTVQQTDITSNGGGNGRIKNTATVSIREFPPVTVEVETPIKLPYISGTVKEDTNNSGQGNVTSGDIPIANVLILLGNSTNGNIVATTLTDSNGFYAFVNMKPGNYFVVEQNPSGYVDVADFDGGPNLSNISVPGVSGGNFLLVETS